MVNATSKKYDWEDIQETTWTNVELGTTSGYKFPCGRCFPSEFFSKSEAIERHNDKDCYMCEKMEVQ